MIEAELIRNQINPEKKLSEIVNQTDKESKKMSLLVFEVSEEFAVPDKSIKNIICPKCKEICFFNLKNYKISLNNCNNDHKTENILLNEFEALQNLDLTTIKCGFCPNNKSTSNNNIFYKCYTCNMNLCTQCKSIHDKRHNIINYDDKDYKYIEHFESFNSYCKSCNKNLCPLCDNEHNDHKIILFNDLEINESTLEGNKKQLRNKIDSLKKDVNKIQYTLEYIIENMENYYKIYEQIINNLEQSRKIIKYYIISKNLIILMLLKILMKF